MAEKILKATHSGVIKIGNSEIPCHVLENGERILSTRGIMKSLGRTWRGRKYSGTQLPVFLEAKNLKDYITEELEPVLTPIIFQPRSGYASEGYKAEVLPIICEIYLRARDEGTLIPSQVAIAKNCEILVRALSRVALIALIDEATGYQYERDRNELNKILEAYISKELLQWSKRFPDEFYRELFRLRGWRFSPFSVKRPQFVGKLTNQLIYEKLPPGVLDELRVKNPKNEKGRRRHKFFQFLTEDIGNPHLEKQLVAVTTLMKVSANWRKFEGMFKRAFPAELEQMEMPFIEEDD